MRARTALQCEASFRVPCRVWACLMTTKLAVEGGKAIIQGLQDSPSYKMQVLYLATVVAHELQHMLRFYKVRAHLTFIPPTHLADGTLQQSQDPNLPPTPPRLRTNNRLVRRQREPSGRIEIWGESGWVWEQTRMGGGLQCALSKRNERRYPVSSDILAVRAYTAGSDRYFDLR